MNYRIKFSLYYKTRDVEDSISNFFRRRINLVAVYKQSDNFYVAELASQVSRLRLYRRISLFSAATLHYVMHRRPTTVLLRKRVLAFKM